jgi:hypothetical protein
MGRHWTSEDVNSLMRSFQGLCVLGAAAELDVFALLTPRPATARELAHATHADLRAMTMLLDALAAMDVLDKTADRYACAPGIAAALTPGPGSVLAMTRHQMCCLRRWTQIARVVQTGTPADRTPSIRGEAGDQQSFIEAMNDISGPLAGEIVRDINIIPWKHLLDVGGASGTYTLAWLALNPAARATLFDLPHVIPLARARTAAAPCAPRITFAAGDFTTDPLPAGADLAWVSAIIHQQSRAMNQDLFRKVAAALVPDGHIMIRDIIMDESRTAPPAGAMFAINMLTATANGGTFTLREIQEDLQAAGFHHVRQIRRDAWMNAVVCAQR